MLTEWHSFSANEDDRDIVDSDFSIDENDEPVTDNEEEGPKRRKKVLTRSYKEPSKQPPKKATPKKKVIKSPSKSSPEKRAALHEAKKSLRRSTTLKSVATQHRVKARDEAERKKPKVVKNNDPIPTQEELLEEAVRTEAENILSLEKFRRMEMEKKKVRPSKATTYTGPIIRYHSVSMPVIHDEPKTKETLEEQEEKKRTTRRSRMAATDAAKVAEKNRCERTFVTFENDLKNTVFESIFPAVPKKPRHRQYCSVTRLPARYFDPVTQLPYYNCVAFKIIRESYYQMLESKGDPADATVSTWLEWRKKWKESRAKTIKAEQA